LWNGSDMETNIDLPRLHPTVERLAQRAETQLAIWRQVQAGNLPPRSIDESLNAWVQRDSAAYRNSYGASVNDIARYVARSAAACPPYADLLRQRDPRLTESIRPEVELLGLTNFFSKIVNLLPANVGEQVSQANTALQELLSDSARMRALEDELAKRLAWIDPAKIMDAHAAVASALGRDDAVERGNAAAYLRESSVTSEPIEEHRQHEAQLIADFIATNKGLLSWKIRDNIREADEPLKALLRDQGKAEELNNLIHERLSGINPSFIADVQAIIATELGRPDAADRSREAALLHQGEPIPELTDSVARVTPPRTHDTGAPDEAPSRQAEVSPLSASPKLHPHRPGLPAAEAKNGFAPGEPNDRATRATPVGDILERMSYKSMKDGSVLYSVDQQPAFVDHGDQLLMVRDSESSDQAILGALLLATEKYHGRFEITGTPEFTRRAISVILKYRIDARLNNPEQDALLRTMGQEVQTVHQAASHDHTVLPIEPTSITPPFSSKAASSKAEEAVYPPRHDTPDPLAGTVVNFGSAPYRRESGNALSFYVTLENADGQQRTTWGVDLARAIKSASIQIGDQVVLQNMGKSPVECVKPTFDTKGNFTGTTSTKSQKIAWDIRITGRASPVCAPEPKRSKSSASPTSPPKRVQRTSLPAKPPPRESAPVDAVYAPARAARRQGHLSMKN
jgi:hypothetical protein